MKKKDQLERVSPDLAIDEHIDFHNTGFVVQKVGLIFIFGLVVLAAAGFFGDGVLSATSVSAGNSTIEYDEFYRFEARLDLKVHLTSVADPAVISFSNDYLNSFRIESINPEPKETRIGNDLVHFYFPGTGAMDITFHLIPQKVGSISGTMEVQGQSVSLQHFIHP
jgi:hypothetical protein